MPTIAPVTSSLLIAVFAIVPAAIIWLAHRAIWARKIGVVVLCYLCGLAAGNSGLFSAQLLPAQTQLTEVSIALAMPLLLFTLDIRQWRQLAGKALLSMLLASTAVVTIATGLYFCFAAQGVASADHFAAMSVGVYTGGTPNLAAIKTGLDIPHGEYIVFHSLDTLLGSIYLMAMLTVGIPFFRALLPRPPVTLLPTGDTAQQFDSDDYSGLLQRSNLIEIGKSLALSIMVVAAAQGCVWLAAHLTGRESSGALMIVAITSLSILLSLSPRVRQLQLSYKLGMYLIYVFCFAVASMASLEQLAGVNLSVAGFLLGTIVGSLLLHALLCRWLRVDGDTFMVTSVAAVCSPPFVPMMARALNNPAMLFSGMTTGIIGYALGNYLGISLGLVLQGL